MSAFRTELMTAASSVVLYVRRRRTAEDVRAGEGSTAASSLGGLAEGVLDGAGSGAIETRRPARPRGFSVFGLAARRLAWRGVGAGTGSSLSDVDRLDRVLAIENCPVRGSCGRIS